MSWAKNPSFFCSECICPAIFLANCIRFTSAFLPVETVSEQIYELEFILKFYFLFILLAAFYNLRLYIKYRDKVSWLFAAGLVSLGLYNLSLHGLEEIFFSHKFVARHLDIFPFFTGGLAVIFIITFCREFLHSREYAPFLDQMLLGLAVFTGIFMITGVFALHGVMNALLFMTAAASAAIIQIAGYIGYVKGFKSAGFLALVTQLTALGVLMLAFEQFGLITAEVTEIVILTGEGIRAVFISRAIKIRINRAQKTIDL